jgi:hypothetical protein
MATKSNRIITWALRTALGVTVFICSAHAAHAADYVVKETLHVGGEGGFDYVTMDADGKLLYLPRTSHTQVVDAASGKVLADVPDNARSHGVALVPELGRGFISNGGDGTVQVFDLKSNQSLGKIKAAEDADCIIYDAASARQVRLSTWAASRNSPFPTAKERSLLISWTRIKSRSSIPRR